MVWEIIKNMNIICKNCDEDIGSLGDILTCPKCKEELLKIIFDIKTKDKRIVL